MFTSPLRPEALTGDGDPHDLHDPPSSPLSRPDSPSSPMRPDPPPSPLWSDPPSPPFKPDPLPSPPDPSSSPSEPKRARYEFNELEVVMIIN